MSVKAIKLASSEELIGEVVGETDTTIKLKNVVTVAIQQTEKGPALGFMPFMPYLPKNAGNYVNELVRKMFFSSDGNRFLLIASYAALVPLHWLCLLPKWL